MGAINAARINIGNVIKDTTSKFPITATGALGILTVAVVSLAAGSYLTQKVNKAAENAKEKIATLPPVSLTTKEVKSQKTSKFLDFFKSYSK
jgi:hypothetical protein